MAAATDSLRDYRRAFARYRAAVQQVQQLVANPVSNTAEVDAALLDLELARSLYTHQRNAAAEELLPEFAHMIDSTASESKHVREMRVRTLAQLLWEAGGRRDGAADRDWSRAEQIIGRAAAQA